MERNLQTEDRTILTLDAGGTNFVFSAIRNHQEIIKPIRYPAHAHDLDKCLENIFRGFSKVSDMLQVPPAAISFAFPGPADYEKGIIGDLPNFEAFNDNVPLGPMLEDKFNIPVFINNDGNLFAFGEALSGYLPELNRRIVDAGGIKQYKNLIGVTLGTGFGGGIVLNNTMVVGDSSCGAEVHNTLNKFNAHWNAEESVSTRAIQRVYAEHAGLELDDTLMPADIAAIAKGSMDGHKEAALQAFRVFGEALGSSLSNFLTLLDGIAVLGGGITASWDLFSPSMFQEIDRKYKNHKGNESARLSFRVFNLEDDQSFDEFALGRIKQIAVPGSNRTIAFDDLPRTGVGCSRIGASKAISMGAYAYALQQLEK